MSIFSDIFNNKVTAGIFIGGSALLAGGIIKSIVDVNNFNRELDEELKKMGKVPPVVNPIEINNT